MRPTIFLFSLVRKERRCRARYQKEKIAKTRAISMDIFNLSPADNEHLGCPVRKTTPLSRIRLRRASLTLAPLAGVLTSKPRLGREIKRWSEVPCSAERGRMRD